MNLLMIAPEQIPLPPLSSGSVETCMYHIAKQLAKKHHVTIISRRHPRHRNVTIMGNLKIIRVPSKSASHYITNVIKKVKSLSRQRPFDWIQIDNRPQFVPIVKKHFPKTPVSIFLHSLTYVTPPKTATKAAAAQLRKADLILCNSRSLKAELTHLIPKYSRKMTVVLLGVDTKKFRPPTLVERTQVRKQRHIKKDAFVIVFAGRLIPIKGLPVLIRAVSIAQQKLPHMKLVIAGGSRKKSYASYLRRLAAGLSVSADFLGSVPRKRMHQVFWLADLFVCPSQGHEAFGLVAVEAMASGVPSMASNNGGPKEVIKHNKTGIRVTRYRKAEAFAEAIIRVASNKRLQRRLGTSGRHDVNRYFSWRQTAARLERLYRRELK